MKKLIYIFCLLSIVLVSCSEDSGSDASFSINGTKLRRTIMNLRGGAVITEDAFYNGTKILTSTVSDGTAYRFTYTGDLVTKFEFFRDDVLDNVTSFTYNNDKLIGYTSIRGNSGYRVDYTYNSDGTISISGYTGDSVNQNNQTDLNKKVFFQDGVVSRIEEYKIIEGNPETLTTAYTHDNANSPSSRTLGFDKLTMYDQGLSAYNHNITSITTTATNSTDVSVLTMTYWYNTSNFPYKANYGGNMAIEYFYE